MNSEENVMEGTHMLQQGVVVVGEQEQSTHRKHV